MKPTRMSKSVSEIDWSSYLSELLNRPVSVSSRKIASLWAGYGSVIGLKVVEGTTRSVAVEDDYIAKLVSPPKGAGVSHQRKLRSYEVESAFYRHCAGGVLECTSCAIPRPLMIDTNAGTSFLFILSNLAAQFSVVPDVLDLEQSKSALQWLAGFHAFFWESIPDVGLWDEGTYWHLATRKSEHAAIPRQWQQLKEVAGMVDEKLKGSDVGGNSLGNYRTLVHGDFKSENLLFSHTNVCAAFDFQYCGEGYGTKDVAYLLCSSVDETILQKHDQELLAYYFEHLHNQLRAQQKDAPGYTWETMMLHYKLSLIDYARFMAGWGWWGNVSWCQDRVRSYLKDIASTVNQRGRPKKG